MPLRSPQGVLPPVPIEIWFIPRALPQWVTTAVVETRVSGLSVTTVKTEAPVPTLHAEDLNGDLPPTRVVMIWAAIMVMNGPANVPFKNVLELLRSFQAVVIDGMNRLELHLPARV